MCTRHGSFHATVTKCMYLCGIIDNSVCYINRVYKYEKSHTSHISNTARMIILTEAFRDFPVLSEEMLGYDLESDVTPSIYMLATL
jgi:hypothetical protein